MRDLGSVATVFNAQCKVTLQSYILTQHFTNIEKITTYGYKLYLKTHAQGITYTRFPLTRSFYNEI